jgi:RNA polymerase sigma-70 factor (ECF subfamily)
MILKNSDEKIISSFCEGKKEAFKELIDKYSSSIYNFLAQITGIENATDLSQEVFIKIWKNLKKFQHSKASFKTWIFTIAKNTAIDFLRKKKSIPFSKMEIDIIENIKDENLLPDEILIKSENIELLKEKMKFLSPLYKTILSLHYQEELTFEEIGKILEKPTNTIKSYHYRAISELRKKIL